MLMGDGWLPDRSLAARESKGAALLRITAGAGDSAACALAANCVPIFIGSRHFVRPIAPSCLPPPSGAYSWRDRGLTIGETTWLNA